MSAKEKDGTNSGQSREKVGKKSGKSREKDGMKKCKAVLYNNHVQGGRARGQNYGEGRKRGRKSLWGERFQKKERQEKERSKEKEAFVKKKKEINLLYKVLLC